MGVSAGTNANDGIGSCPQRAAEGAVDIWWIDSRPLASEEHLLAPDERERAVRFRLRRDRERWVGAHVGLRQILARYAAEPPGALAFVRGPAGKPALAGASPWDFSLAHAGDRAVLAVARGREIGIDLEARAGTPWDARTLHGLIGVACAPAESARLQRLPPAERSDAFLTLWTAKEAYLKATGIGLAQDPRSVEVTLDAAERLAIHDRVSPAAPPWRIVPLDAGPAWVGVLVYGGPEAAVTYGTWPQRPLARGSGR